MHKPTRSLSFFLSAMFAFSLCLLSACNLLNSFTKSNPPAPSARFWLKTSLYAGDFYDDNRTVLIDHRPFSALADAKTWDDYTIYPHHPTHIITVGTQIEITAISYPESQSSMKRPLFSPKNNVWVFFKVAKERGLVSIFEHKPHVMMLPSSIKTPQEVKKYLGELLTKHDPTPWLLNQESHFQQGILLKRPSIGMSPRHVQATLGPPESKTETFDGSGIATEVWSYPSHFMVFKDDAVVTIKNLTSPIQ